MAKPKKPSKARLYRALDTLIDYEREIKETSEVSSRAYAEVCSALRDLIDKLEEAS